MHQYSIQHRAPILTTLQRITSTPLITQSRLQPPPSPQYPAFREQQQQPAIRPLPLKATRIHIRTPAGQATQTPESESVSRQVNITPNGRRLGRPITLPIPITRRFRPAILSRLQQSAQATERSGKLPRLHEMRRPDLFHLCEAMCRLQQGDMQEVHSRSRRRGGRMVSRLLFTEPQLVSTRREGSLVVLVHSSKAGVLVLLAAASSETLSSIIMKRRFHHKPDHVSFVILVPLLNIQSIQ